MLFSPVCFQPSIRSGFPASAPACFPSLPSPRPCLYEAVELCISGKQLVKAEARLKKKTAELFAICFMGFGVLKKLLGVIPVGGPMRDRQAQGARPRGGWARPQACGSLDHPWCISGTPYSVGLFWSIKNHGKVSWHLGIV